uniref:NADH dehydrogenase subunit 3 n=1 Tax=Heterorhabditis bacteriophora TaxID=37862 RepID=A0A1I7W7T0_HETBA
MSQYNTVNETPFFNLFYIIYFLIDLKLGLMFFLS